jgi:hypothetical protein
MLIYLRSISPGRYVVIVNLTNARGESATTHLSVHAEKALK